MIIDARKLSEKEIVYLLSVSVAFSDKDRRYVESFNDGMSVKKTASRCGVCVARVYAVRLNAIWRGAGYAYNFHRRDFFCHDFIIGMKINTAFEQFRIFNRAYHRMN